ncbi:DUF6612 family protein [Thermoflavimicrobium daqui]|jgi:hypothetical protein|uniref:Lipoprotein n=1 Tax=Thermoflavimicrobium daqui TaxID=2137476 RepID=A0A364K504_9BACL|nr:DUF6612 family protein [Thermoflavimicrobium daqui]RAL24417.1 hypothetical protein DL897_08820 [Thermoflavimicrobium daqui]
MKRFIYLLFSTLLVFGLLVGCSSEEETKSGGDSGSSDTQSDSSSSKVSTVKAKEVINKVAKDFDKLDGVTYKETVSGELENEGVKQTFSLNGEGKMSISPYKEQISGKSTFFGTELSYESYQDESYAYFRSKLDNKWKKQKAEPREWAKDLQDLAGYIDSEKKNNDFAKVTQNGSKYSFDLNLEKAKSDSVKDQIKDKAKSIIVEVLGDNKDFKIGDVRIEKYNVKLESDDKKPMLKKLITEFDVLLPQDSKLIKVHIKQEIEVKGKYDERIDIPSEATSAKEES